MNLVRICRDRRNLLGEWRWRCVMKPRRKSSHNPVGPTLAVNARARITRQMMAEMLEDDAPEETNGMTTEDLRRMYADD